MYNLGTGTDKLTLLATGSGANSLALNGVESVLGGSGADTVTLTTQTTTGNFNLGCGADTLVLGSFNNTLNN